MNNPRSPSIEVGDSFFSIAPTAAEISAGKNYPHRPRLVSVVEMVGSRVICDASCQNLAAFTIVAKSDQLFTERHEAEVAYKLALVEYARETLSKLQEVIHELAIS